MTVSRNRHKTQYTFKMNIIFNEKLYCANNSCISYAFRYKNIHRYDENNH